MISGGRMYEDDDNADDADDADDADYDERT